LRALIILPFFFFLSCNSGKNRQKEIHSYFKDELAHRVQQIEKLKQENDSLNINTVEVEENITRLLLLSKDIENLQASINSARTYFDEVSEKYHLNRYDFIDIDKTMSLEEIEISIRSNQVNLYNQIIFKYGKPTGGMYTAQ